MHNILGLKFSKSTFHDLNMFCVILIPKTTSVINKPDIRYIESTDVLLHCSVHVLILSKDQTYNLLVQYLKYAAVLKK